MKKFQKYTLISLAACALFILGVVGGSIYHDFRFLCDSPTPHILTEKMVSENGIIFPKGTVVPLKHCAYRKRFNWEFAMDLGANVDTVEIETKEDYGFSLLEVDESSKAKN